MYSPLRFKAPNGRNVGRCVAIERRIIPTQNFPHFNKIFRNVKQLGKSAVGSACRTLQPQGGYACIMVTLAPRWARVTFRDHGPVAPHAGGTPAVRPGLGCSTPSGKLFSAAEPPSRHASRGRRCPRAGVAGLANADAQDWRRCRFRPRASAVRSPLSRSRLSRQEVRRH